MSDSSVAVRVLKVVAWVALIGGIVGGIAIIVASSAAQELDPNTFQLVEGGRNAAGIGMGLFIMLQGLIMWAALMAFAQVADGVASISQQVSEMNRRGAPRKESGASGSAGSPVG